MPLMVSQQVIKMVTLAGWKIPWAIQQPGVRAIVGLLLLAATFPAYPDSSKVLNFSAEPTLLSGNSLQSGAVYRIPNVAPFVDATVEVLRIHQGDLLSIDNNMALPRALQPAMRANAEGAFVEIAVSLTASGRPEIHRIDLQASVIGLVNNITTIYSASDYTLETGSFVTAMVDSPATLHLYSVDAVQGVRQSDSVYAASVTLNQQKKLIVRVTARKSGSFSGSVLFEPVPFVDPVFYNINDAPIANDDREIVNRNERLDVPAEQGLLSNDTDADTLIDGDRISIDSFEINEITYPPDTAVSIAEGTLTISQDGAFEFMPSVNFTGNIAGIDYRLVDEHGADDFGTLSLLALNRVVKRTTANVTDPVLTISEDTNNDGYINRAELSGRINVAVTVPSDALSDQRMIISSQFERVTVVLDEDHLREGVVSVSFETPSDGATLDFSLLYISANDDLLTQKTRSVKLDLTPTEKPQIEIVADVDNSGFLSADEYQSELTVLVHLPATAVVNDQVTIANNNDRQTIVLTPLDVAEGMVRVVLPAAPDGQSFSLTAVITDEAGNSSETGSDSVQIDTTPPPLPQVSGLHTSSATPVINGLHPIDNDYLLAVAVNGVTYVAGDGYLQKMPQGEWQLSIPASDALPHGVYDVIATVTDIAGNAVNDNTSAELAVDLKPPALVVDNVGLSTDTAPMIRGFTDQSNHSKVLVTVDQGSPLCEALVKDGQWRCRVRKLLSVGDNNLVATGADELDNQAAIQFTVRVASATDSDGDGIADDIESTADTDQDGVPDYIDLDSDNDGITDHYESLLDSDDDGTRDYRDIDSDGDGISDLIEAGFSSVNAKSPVGDNGIPDQFEQSPGSGEVRAPRDTDGDLIDDYRDIDSDNDGLTDALENAGASSETTPLALDTDLDRIPDYRDLDSDQDGLADIIEQFLTDSDRDGRVDEFVDMNVDGLHDDLLAADTAQDTDADGLANTVDLDSDGDGRTDIVESMVVDNNKDGQLDDFADRNGNGIPDQVDQFYTRGIDADQDFIDDLYDVDHTSGEDLDADGIVDAFDVDADGDGFLDSLAGAPPPESLADVYEFVPDAGAVLGTGTGVLGNGCSMIFGHRNNVQRYDWSLLLLLVSAVCGLVYRRRDLRQINC